LTVERAIEIFAGLWQEKQAQLERVTERAKRRKAALDHRGKRSRQMNPARAIEE
jgi:hypothetical protein